MKLKNPLETGPALGMDMAFVTPATLLAPAKLNLFLAITERRADGYHNLVSVVVPLEFGDTLTAEVADAPSETVPVLSCTDPDVPCDDTNLVIRAAKAFAEAAQQRRSVHFHLEKRIPMGAGLGGGSSDGVAALRALNTLAGGKLDASEMGRLASELGSDCPLFLRGAPVIMRGRGERVETLPEQAARRLRGRRVIVFKPPFGIPTAWAYRRMAELAVQKASLGRDGVYLPEADAERLLSEWVSNAAAEPEALLFNNLERPAFSKYLAIPTLLEQLRRDHGLAPRMTGSGSACFAFLKDDAPVEAITGAIRRGWGDAAFVIVTRIA